MRRTNFSLRVQPSLMEEARQAAESDGVSLNQLIIVALAEKLSALRTGRYFQERIRRANRAETPRVPDRAGKGNPPLEGGEVLVDGLHASPEAFSVKVHPAPAIGPLPVLIAAVTRGVKVQPVLPPDLEQAGETGKPTGRAAPQFGKLKRQLEKARGR